jgi:hypothetical protein
MPLDEQAKQFLGAAPIREVAGQTSTDAERRQLEFRKKEFLQRAGQFAEDLIAFFIQQRKKNDYLDDECAGAIALFAINLRHSYGEPQNAEEKAKWSDAVRDERLREFDTICEAMQAYFDEEK